MAKRPGLGRIYERDERDDAHPFALALAPVPLTHKTWMPGAIMDQGQTSECVAFSWKGWLTASPIRQARLLDQHQLYQDAQAQDGHPLPHDGSTVRAGAKVLAAQGYVAEYLWAQSVDDVRAWLLAHGPVVLGTRWYESMFSLASNGYAPIMPGARVAGGHAYLCIGYSAARDAFRCVNSWGADWGERGRFWLRYADLARLLDEDGEGCTATELHRVAA